jgi:hypothetical protein
MRSVVGISSLKAGEDVKIPVCDSSSPFPKGREEPGIEAMPSATGNDPLGSRGLCPAVAISHPAPGVAPTERG